MSEIQFTEHTSERVRASESKGRIADFDKTVTQQKKKTAGRKDRKNSGRTSLFSLLLQGSRRIYHTPFSFFFEARTAQQAFSEYETI